MDKGWVLIEDENAWALYDHHGDRVYGTTVPVGVLERAGSKLLGEVNRFGAGLERRWPELNPEAGSWWQCVIEGGAVDGAREYLDPEIYRDGPPDALVFAFDDAEEAGPAQPVTLTDVVTYRRQARWACTHGDGCRGCPVPYTLAAG